MQPGRHFRIGERHRDMAKNFFLSRSEDLIEGSLIADTLVDHASESWTAVALAIAHCCDRAAEFLNGAAFFFNDGMGCELGELVLGRNFCGL